MKRVEIEQRLVTSATIHSQRKCGTCPSQGKLLRVCFTLEPYLPAISAAPFSSFHLFNLVNCGCVSHFLPLRLFLFWCVSASSDIARCCSVGLHFYIFTTAASYFVKQCLWLRYFSILCSLACALCVWVLDLISRCYLQEEKASPDPSQDSPAKLFWHTYFWWVSMLYCAALLGGYDFHLIANIWVFLGCCSY